MESLIRICWGALAAAHAMPALTFFRPAMAETLYGISPQDDLGLLIVHRGALFLAIVVASLFGMMHPASRRLAAVVVAISVLGFLWLYAGAGFPDGALRTIAIVDAIALVPLAIVSIAAWRGK